MQTFDKELLDTVPHLRREVNRAGIASHHVPLEDLLTHHLEAIEDVEDDDLVIHGLACQPLAWNNVRITLDSSTGFKVNHLQPSDDRKVKVTTIRRQANSRH